MKPTKYEGYFVDEEGKVYSNKRGRLKEMKITKNSHGYGTVHLAGIGVVKVHRLVYDTFIGIPEGMTIDHINSDKTDNRLCNLQHMTLEENVRKGSLGKPKKRKKLLGVIIDGVPFKSIEEGAEYLGVKRDTLYKCVRLNRKLRGHENKNISYL